MRSTTLLIRSLTLASSDSLVFSPVDCTRSDRRAPASSILLTRSLERSSISTSSESPLTFSESMHLLGARGDVGHDVAGAVLEIDDDLVEAIRHHLFDLAGEFDELRRGRGRS